MTSSPASLSERLLRLARVIQADKRHLFEAEPEHIAGHMLHCSNDEHMGCVYIQAVMALREAAEACAPAPDVLREALIEMQSASWSRNWKRVKAARARVKALLGFDVPGPLTASLVSVPDPARAEEKTEKEI